MDGWTAHRASVANATDYRGETCLHVTVRYNHISTAQIILKNTAGSNINAQGNRGRTALHLAVLLRHEALPKLLIENGADVEVADAFGFTAFNLAASTGDLDTMLLIMARITNPDTLNNMRKIASDFTVPGRREEAVDLAISGDVDTDITRYIPGKRRGGFCRQDLGGWQI